MYLTTFYEHLVVSKYTAIQRINIPTIHIASPFCVCGKYRCTRCTNIYILPMYAPVTYSYLAKVSKNPIMIGETNWKFINECENGDLEFLHGKISKASFEFIDGVNPLYQSHFNLVDFEASGPIEFD